MGLKFRCKACGKDILVRFLKVGEAAKCKSCGTSNPIPASAESIDDENATTYQSRARQQGEGSWEEERVGKINLSDFIEAIILFRTADNRTIFRPWTRWGPWYLVREAERARFLRVFGTAYLLFFLLVPVAARSGGVRAITILGGIWLLSLYLLCWVMSRNLPRTEPVPMTSELRQKHAQRIVTDLGRGTIWILEIVSMLFTIMGIWIITAGETWTGLGCAMFFGACAAVYGWYLHLTSRLPN